LSRRPADTDGLQMRAGPGRLMLAIDRDDYWQVAYVIAKGSIEQIRATGLEALRRSVAGVAPDLAGRVSEIGAWDDVKMLTVRIDRLRRWYAPGVLLIGDAAHAMSPIGGVGINLAVQDAVAAARILAGPLLAGELATSDLAKVRSRRAFPTIGTQLLQRAAQRFVVARVLAARGPVTAPAPLRLLRRLPTLQRVPARIIGVGLRPEHLQPYPK